MTTQYRTFDVEFNGIGGTEVFSFKTKEEQDAFCMGLEIALDDGYDGATYSRQEGVTIEKTI